MEYIKKLNYLLEKRTKKRMLFVLFNIIVGSALELLGISILLPLINLAVDTEHATDNFAYKTVEQLFGLAMGTVLWLAQKACASRRTVPMASRPEGRQPHKPEFMQEQFPCLDNVTPAT